MFRLRPSAAFSANNIADWATHDLIANVLLGAASGTVEAEVALNLNDPNFAHELLLGTAIGAGIGAIAAVSDGLGNIWEPEWAKHAVVSGLFSLFGATGAFFTAKGYICNTPGRICIRDPGFNPKSDISSGHAHLTAERRQGVPSWSFDGTSLLGDAATS